MKPTSKKGSVSIYNIKKIMTDDEAAAIGNTRLTRGKIKYIIDHDADVYARTTFFC